MNVSHKDIKSTIYLNLQIKEVFETIETVYVDTTTTSSSKMIEPIVKRSFGYTFNNKNILNQRQYIHEHAGEKYQTTTFQISKNFSTPYLK